MGELTRERQFRRLLLQGLSVEEVGQYLEVNAGVHASSALAGRVHAQTEGNPLFVTEVARLLAQEEGFSTAAEGGPDIWRVPEGVRDVIGRRLSRLSPDCNRALNYASVIGREFTLEQLQTIFQDLPGNNLLVLLEEALSNRIIEELPQVMGHYQFTHALVQETLIEELSLTSRMQLHAHIARALEDLYTASVAEHSAELAYHYAHAQILLGTKQLVPTGGGAGPGKLWLGGSVRALPAGIGCQRTCLKVLHGSLVRLSSSGCWSPV